MVVSLSLIPPFALVGLITYGTMVSCPMAYSLTVKLIEDCGIGSSTRAWLCGM